MHGMHFTSKFCNYYGASDELVSKRLRLRCINLLFVYFPFEQLSDREELTLSCEYCNLSITNYFSEQQQGQNVVCTLHVQPSTFIKLLLFYNNQICYIQSFNILNYQRQHLPATYFKVS